MQAGKLEICKPHALRRPVLQQVGSQTLIMLYVWGYALLE